MLTRFAKEALIRKERKAQRSFKLKKEEELYLPEVKESLGRLPEKIREVILEYPSVLRRKLPAFSTLKMEPAKIILKEGREEEGYHCGGCRKTPLHKRRQASQLIEDLKAQGIIEPTIPDKWLTPAHFVMKQDGESLRLVTDFTGVNKLTRRIPHGYPTGQQLRDAIKP